MNAYINRAHIYDICFLSASPLVKLINNSAKKGIRVLNLWNLNIFPYMYNILTTIYNLHTWRIFCNNVLFLYRSKGNISSINSSMKLNAIANLRFFLPLTTKFSYKSYGEA